MMADILSKLIPVMITIAILGVMMLMVLGVGWVSGKLIRKMFGLGGN